MIERGPLPALFLVLFRRECASPFFEGAAVSLSRWRPGALASDTLYLRLIGVDYKR